MTSQLHSGKECSDPKLGGIINGYELFNTFSQSTIYTIETQFAPPPPGKNNNFFQIFDI